MPYSSSPELAPNLGTQPSHAFPENPRLPLVLPAALHAERDFGRLVGPFPSWKRLSGEPKPLWVQAAQV